MQRGSWNQLLGVILVPVKVGFVLPGGDVESQVEQAVEAEAAGWDGVFVWEGAYHPDAWCLLGAIAVRTTRIRIGTMLTPLPWRRPWTVASQAATVDRLSGGRVILTVGLGAPETGRAASSEPLDRRERAALLDDGIEICRRLWAGERDFHGRRNVLDLSAEPTRSLRPVQRRIPIWVVGAWNRRPSMQRALRCDGVVPVILDDAGDFAGSYTAMARAVHAASAQLGRPIDVIREGETPVNEPEAGAERLARWRDRGATWWLETRWGHPPEVAAARIAAGPPRPVSGQLL